MSINRRMDTQNVVYPHTWILFANWSKWNTDNPTTWMTLENIMLSERGHTKKGHILYNSIYMNCPNSKSMETRSRLVVVRGFQGGDEEWGVICNILIY